MRDRAFQPIVTMAEGRLKNLLAEEKINGIPRKLDDRWYAISPPYWMPTSSDRALTTRMLKKTETITIRRK
jgi:hypothetical protein